MSDREPFSDENIPPQPVTATSSPMTIVDQGSGETRPTRNGCLWGVGGAVGCLVLLLIVPLTLVALGVTSFSGLLGGLGGVLGAPPPPQASVISTQTILQGIQPMGQLVSVSAQLAKADVMVNINQGTLNACGFGANHVVQGAVEAGIDLTRITEDSIQYDEAREMYVMIVPAPELTSCRVDYIRQYSRSFTTCAVDWDEARVLANYMALTSFRDDAVEGGILTRAETETRLVLGNFIRLLTGRQVEIVFQQPETPTVPVSCQPEVPQGWTLNPDNGLWVK